MSDKESLIDGIINLLTGKKNEPISVEGYEFAGRVKLGRHPLVLNGAGVRTIGDKKIYALGLYLPEKTQREDTARALLGARRAEIVILSPLDASKFIDSLHAGISENTNETSRDFISNELSQIEEFMKDLSNLKPGDVVDVDWIPSRGTFVYYNRQLMGNPVRGKAVYDAVLSIWLGRNALESELRDELLDIK